MTIRRQAAAGRGAGRAVARGGSLAARGGALALAVLGTAAMAQGAGGEAPKYGGKLEIGTIYVTLSPLSWDPADWAWKINHDAGGIYEQLFVGDLAKAIRNGGKYGYFADAWLPSDSVKGELAESWRWVEPLRLEITLRKGVMFPAKEGVMKARELVADDVVFSFERLANSPKATKGYFDYVKKVSAVGSHTVVFEMSEFNAEWDYRFGWGYYSAIVPKEVVDAGATNWKNVNGTGPFMLTGFVQGNSQTYGRNPGYWGKTTVAGKEYQMPFVDQVVYRTIKDEATQHTALRTGKLDMLEIVRWQAVDELKKSAPQLKWKKNLNMSGTFMAMRVDTKPFDDIRVRRAMNMAVNKQEIVKAFYNGNAELFAYPQHPSYDGYFEPLSAMPDEIKELFAFDQAKARRLLKEAGYPNGFSFKVQVCSCNPEHMDLVPLLASYYEQVGVKMEIQPMEYAAFLSAMTTQKNAAGYFMNNGHTNPTTTIRKSFLPRQVWNPAQWDDPAYSKRMLDVYAERDEGKRQQVLRELTREILGKAPYVWLPTPYVYMAWWPWVKNYDGELRVGATRPWPVYSQIWVDQDLKKKMGF